MNNNLDVLFYHKREITAMKKQKYRDNFSKGAASYADIL